MAFEAGAGIARIKPACGSLLRDGSACKAVASKAFSGLCQHHGLVAIGLERGWRVRGSRRAGVYVAERGSRVLVADTASELLELLDAEAGLTPPPMETFRAALKAVRLGKGREYWDGC